MSMTRNTYPNAENEAITALLWREMRQIHLKITHLVKWNRIDTRYSILHYNAV